MRWKHHRPLPQMNVLTTKSLKTKKLPKKMTTNLSISLVPMLRREVLTHQHGKERALIRIPAITPWNRTSSISSASPRGTTTMREQTRIQTGAKKATVPRTI